MGLEHSARRCGMNDLFTHGHRQLFESQGTGLHAAWRRAAIEAARHPAAPAEEGVPTAGHAASPRPRHLAAVFAVAVLAAALAGALCTPADDAADAAGTPAAPVQWLAQAG
jgi:hypothetical protein